MKKYPKYLWERFENLYIPEPNTGCWLWLGYLNRHGYAMYNNWRVTRLVVNPSGLLPADSHVCHKCDTPCCVNPNHLFVGSAADNLADMRRKGRQAKGDTHGSKTYPEQVVRGERRGCAKLTKKQVEYIRNSKISPYVLGPRLGVSPQQIYRIRKGESWTA